MSKVSTLARSGRELILAFVLIAFAVLASGCGGSSDAATVPPPSGNNPPPPPPPPAAVIEGVATPTSVAVVTATNAQ
jgi:hypothetical protein